MLGFEQEQWLLGRFAASTARWNVLGQQVIMARLLLRRDRYLVDHWSGYDAARNRLLDAMKSTGLSNPVVLTGDAHAHWALDITENPDDPNAPIVASEFVGTSISSDGDGSPNEGFAALMAEKNYFMKFHNHQRGYVRCDVSPALWRSDMRVVDFVSQPGAPISTAATLVIEDGHRGIKTG